MKRNSQRKIPLSSSIVRNTGYNLVSQGIYVILGFWAIPILVHGLGEEKFGLLALVWALVGYFSLLDFGISRANTKFLSEAIAKGEEEQILKNIWTSLSSTFILGMVSAALIIITTPLLVDNVFKLNAAMRTDAIRFFTIAGCGTPFMLIFGTLKGFQMALQRFDIVNIFQALTGVVQWGGSVLLLWMGFNLTEIVWLVVGLRIILALVTFGTLPLLVPRVFQSIYFIDRSTLKKLWSFGGWVTISQVISPLYLYIDRIFIGMFLSLSAVTYYSVPQEALVRVLVLAISLTATLFPVMSGHSVLSGQENKVKELYHRSVRYLAAIMIPLILGFFLFAPEVVSLWLGKEFAMHSVAIFQVLAFGLFFNSLAQIPTTLLHAIGRPDITAKFHIIELPVALVLNLLLIPWIGIIGAAIAWSIRVTLDAILLFVAAKYQMACLPGIAQYVPVKRKFLFEALLLLGYIISVLLATNIVTKGIIAVLFCGAYAVSTWFHSFDDKDRNFLLHLSTNMFKL
jgi:O-antigen/teichoic acid export membrane protein